MCRGTTFEREQTTCVGVLYLNIFYHINYNVKIFTVFKEDKGSITNSQTFGTILKGFLIIF